MTRPVATAEASTTVGGIAVPAEAKVHIHTDPLSKIGNRTKTYINPMVGVSPSVEPAELHDDANLHNVAAANRTLVQKQLPANVCIVNMKRNAKGEQATFGQSN